MSKKYRIYIDEVGNPDLNSSTNDEHRYLSLTGIILDLDYVSQVVHKELEEIKCKFLIPILMNQLFCIEKNWYIKNIHFLY